MRPKSSVNSNVTGTGSRRLARICPAFASATSGTAPYLDLNVASDDLEEREELGEALAVVCGLEQPIDLRNRCPEPAREFPSAEARSLHVFAGLHRQAVDHHHCHVGGIAVVVEGLIEHHGTLFPGSEQIGNALMAKLAIDEDLRNGIPGRGSWLHAREWQRVRLTRSCNDLYLPLARVNAYASNLHSLPSRCSSRFKRRIRKSARPRMARFCSRFQITTVRPSRSTCTCRGEWSPIQYM